MRMDNLMAWAGSILDRLTYQATEEDEDAVAATAMEHVLPTVAIRSRDTLNDNDA